MATKRMFSKGVIRTDRFLDMPLSTQALYFHLGLDADVKGFVSPRGVMRLLGASHDDLSVLITKGFVVPFESGVILVTHWNINNNVRDTHEAPTQYIEELSKVQESPEGVYILPDNYSSDTVELLRSRDEMSGVEVSRDERKKKPTTVDISPVSFVVEFQDKYPEKDVQGELDKAHLWLQASGKKYKDYKSFYNYWLLRADNQTSRKGGTLDLSKM